MQNNIVKRLKKLLPLVLILCFFTQTRAQNEQISIRSISAQEFEVNSTNGIPFIVILEESKNDGRYNLGSEAGLTFKVSDVIPSKSTLRIIFEKDMYHKMEDNMINQYHEDVNWVAKELQIQESDLKMFTTRPIFTDAGLEKLKQKIFQYTTTTEKERIFDKWIEKINYSVGVIQYLRAVYAASNGEDNEQRSNFLPINITEALQKNR